MTALYRNRSDRFSDLWKGIALLIPKSDRSSFIKVILPESDRYFLTQQPQRLPQPFWDIQIRKLKI
ncbi:MAG: hypothetical protein HEQ10_18265 [Dolichospermum sp. DEX182a]|nr:hypothetical protein [Dolichospermum sp. DEX182a]